MSDGAAPLTESSASGTPVGPSSTADIAASVIHDADATETPSGDEPRLDTTNTAEETPAVEKPAAPTAKELSAAAKFLEQQGHRPKKVDGRDVWLPYGTVEKMLDRYVDTHRSTWDGERTTLSSQAKELRDQLDLIRASVAGDETQFLREIAAIDPRYARFLEQKAAEHQAPAMDTEMPGPDITLPDGSQTYSLKGLQARDAWVEQRILKTLDAKVEERFKPIAEREKAEKARAETEKYREQQQQETAAQLQEAQTWPLFGPLATDGTYTEFQKAVLAELQRDSADARARGWNIQDPRTKHLGPKLSLEAAYIRVAGPRFTEDDAAKRARILKELNDAPKSPALSRQTTDAPRTPGVLSTTEIARRTIAKLESAG